MIWGPTVQLGGRTRFALWAPGVTALMLDIEGRDRLPMTPEAEAQKIRVIRGGFGSPLWAIMSMTKAPESALVMKKIETRMIAMPARVLRW